MQRFVKFRCSRCVRSHASVNVIFCFFCKFTLLFDILRKAVRDEYLVEPKSNSAQKDNFGK